MRKILRNMFRKEAEKKKAKSSKYLNFMWNALQIQRYGVDNREKNKAKGTHEKRVWKSRIESVLG